MADHCENRRVDDNHPQLESFRPVAVLVIIIAVIYVSVIAAVLHMLYGALMS